MYLLKISQYSEILTPKKYRRKKPTFIDWEQCLHVKMKKKNVHALLHVFDNFDTS